MTRDGARVRPGTLAGERAGQRRICQERLRQRGEPLVGFGHRILDEEHHQLSAGILDAEVPRQAVIERAGGNADQPVDARPQQFGRAVARLGVDRDDFEREIDPLARDRVENRRQRGHAVTRRQDDRHARWHHVTCRGVRLGSG